MPVPGYYILVLALRSPLYVGAIKPDPQIVPKSPLRIIQRFLMIISIYTICMKCIKCGKWLAFPIFPKITKISRFAFRWYSGVEIFPKIETDTFPGFRDALLYRKNRKGESKPVFSRSRNENSKVWATGTGYGEGSVRPLGRNVRSDHAIASGIFFGGVALFARS